MQVDYMRLIARLIMVLSVTCSSSVIAEQLPRVTGLELNGDQLSWDAQEGATGYNIHLNYRYYDTVKGPLSYTVTEPGDYHVISFNDNGDFGVTRNPDEIGQPYIFVTYEGGTDSVSYNFTGSTLIVTKTCKDVQPGQSCIALCPGQYQLSENSTIFTRYLSGGACSTSDIVEADAFVGPQTYSCTVPTFSGEVSAQAICVTDR